MDTLIFRPEPFAGWAAKEAGCGCKACQHSELEYEVAPRKRCTDLPPEVKECTTKDQAKMQKCRPGHKAWCAAIPELWKSHTIAGVPFYYGAVVEPVENTGRRRMRLVRAKDKKYEVELTPTTWTAAVGWISSMTGFGMPIAAVITAGAGPYCRCIKKPSGCGEHPETCTGTSPSNHGAGDAIDVTGVVWKDPALVGSSLKATVVHSWKDANEQAPLLIRINAALRLSFSTVIDYSRSDHRDHFHVDTNKGARRNVFSMPAERWFIGGCLKSLGYISTYRKPPTWEDVQPGLAAFASRAGMARPAARDKEAWRPVIQRMYACVAIGSPAGCKP